MLWLRRAIFVLCSFLILPFTSGCTNQAARVRATISDASLPNTTVERVARVVHFLEECPYWERYSTGEKYASRRLKIEENMMQVSNFATAEIRQAVVQYLRRPVESRPPRENNIHVLNRLIFAVPQFKKGTLPPNGVYPPWSITHYDRFDILWPWEQRSNGSFHLRVDAIGGSSGPNIDPLEQFDVFLRIYGRRKL